MFCKKPSEYNEQKYEMDKDSEKAVAREEGLAEGLEKREHKKAIETARKMLSQGLDIDLVSQCTGLSIEEVQALI